MQIENQIKGVCWCWIRWGRWTPPAHASNVVKSELYWRASSPLHTPAGPISPPLSCHQFVSFSAFCFFPISNHVCTCTVFLSLSLYLYTHIPTDLFIYLFLMLLSKVCWCFLFCIFLKRKNKHIFVSLLKKMKSEWSSVVNRCKSVQRACKMHEYALQYLTHLHAWVVIFFFQKKKNLKN